MRTLEVTREFRDRAMKMAEEAKMPEVRARLFRLAREYERHLEKLERVDSDSIAPD